MTVYVICTEQITGVLLNYVAFNLTNIIADSFVLFPPYLWKSNETEKKPLQLEAN